MKKFCIALALSTVLSGGIAGIAPLAVAQQQTQTQTQTAQSGIGDAPQSPAEKVVERLATRLNLTEDQKKQITPIIADRQQQLRELQSNTDMRRMHKARKMKGIVEESDKKIDKVLTAEQRKQYAQLKQERRQELQERRQNQGNSGMNR